MNIQTKEAVPEPTTNAGVEEQKYPTDVEGLEMLKTTIGNQIRELKAKDAQKIMSAINQSSGATTFPNREWADDVGACLGILSQAEKLRETEFGRLSLEYNKVGEMIVEAKKGVGEIERTTTLQ